MGVWGDGVFNGDGACDFLGIAIHRLADVIDEGLGLSKSKQRTRTFRSAVLAKGLVLTLHDPVLPAVAILHAIVSKIPEAQFCIDRRRVRGWMSAYFAWYEDQYVATNGPHKSYRKNAQREFDGLLRKLTIDAFES